MTILQWVIEGILILASLLGIILVLLQSNKGGGLFESGESQHKFIGSNRKGDFLSRATSIFLTIFLCGSIILAYFHYQTKQSPEQSSNKYLEQLKDTNDKNNAPSPNNSTKKKQQEFPNQQ